MNEGQTCVICEQHLCFKWSDTHGVGVCIRCGMPYKIYHYDESGNAVNLPPTAAIIGEWIPVAKAYWSACKRRVFPALFDMGLLGGHGCTYSGATLQDINDWNQWCDSHPELIPESAQNDATAEAVS